MTPLHLPIRARLTLVFAGVLLAVLGVSGALIYRGFAAQLDTVIDGNIAALAQEFVADVANRESDVLSDYGLSEPKDSFARILGRDGEVIETSQSAGNLTIEYAGIAKIPPAGLSDAQALGGGDDPKPVRIFAAAAADGKTVIVGEILADRNTALEKLALLLWICGPAILLIASGLAWFLAGAALSPVERMRREVSLISEGDLGKRLQVPQTKDEIAKLATTLNGLLARLEQAFEKERRFVDDASHELRTPLGILKAELDLALRRSRTKEELQAALAGAAEVSEHLNGLAQNMLVLARSDRGKLPVHKTKLDVANVVTDAAALFQNRAREFGIALLPAAPEGLAIEADALRLKQALGNLIVNALAHTARGGSIEVGAKRNGSADLELYVADSGEGFPAEFIGKAFDPFTRVDAGRSRRDGGAGLGLAIVKGVAEAHGGSASVENRPEGGAIVTLRLPM